MYHFHPSNCQYYVRHKQASQAMLFDRTCYELGGTGVTRVTGFWEMYANRGKHLFVDGIKIQHWQSRPGIKMRLMEVILCKHMQ